MGTEYTGDAEHCTVCVPSRSTCRGVASHGGGNSPVHSPHEQLRHEAVGRIAAEVPRHASRPTKECEAATMPFASQRSLFSICRLVRPAARTAARICVRCAIAQLGFLYVGFTCAHRSHPPACECSCTTYRVWDLSSVPWRVEEEQSGQPANKRVAFRKCFCCCFFVPAIDKQEETFRPVAESHNSKRKYGSKK